MTSQRILSLTEGRSKLFDIAEEVQMEGSYYTLTQHGKPKVVVMSAEEFASWQKTVELLRQVNTIEHDMDRADEDMRAMSYMGLEQLFQKHGYIVSDKAKERYVPSSSIAKRKKRR